MFAGWAEGGELYDCRDHGCGCGFVYEYEPGEPMGHAWSTPLIQITASSEEQTENIYDALRPMIELGPLADLIPKTGEEFIRLPNGGRIDVVTSSAKSRLGQRVTFVPQDETGIWTPQTGMVKVAETQRRGLAGMGGRRLRSRTPGIPPRTPSRNAPPSHGSPTSTGSRSTPAHLSYRDKRERHRIHAIVYKGWWGERNLDSIEAEAAELLERDPAQAERFFGNRIVHGHGSWLADGLWEGCEAAVDVPKGTPVSLGFDGSTSDDWTAIRAETLDGHRFTPTYGPDSRPTIWSPQEWGGQIPHTEVDTAVAEIFDRYEVARMYCDPRDWETDIEAWQLRHGDEHVVFWYTNRIAQMHAALQRSVQDLLTGRSTHDGCPITTQHVGNARKLARPGDRYILGKPSNAQKIDAAMADTLAHEAAADARVAGWGAPKPRRRVVGF
jgi:hypothetical protein